MDRPRRQKRLILFRFDRHPLICRARVALLRRFNPGVPVHGLYGGERGYRGAAFRLGAKPLLRLDAFYRSPHPSLWNWKNGDLLVASWYRDIGHRIDFDVAHLIEWDLLLLDSLERIYRSVPEGAVALTSLTPVPLLEGRWSWLLEPDKRRDSHRLFEHARANLGYEGVPLACMGGGPCFPRAFLADLAAADPPEFGHEELRLPLFAQILGFQLVDSGLCPHGIDRDSDRCFTTTRELIGGEVALSTIIAELERADGRRAFHPVNRRFDRGPELQALRLALSAAAGGES